MQDRAPNGSLDTIALGPDGELVIAGRGGLLEQRTASGTWQPIDLSALLAPYPVPRGEWFRILVDGEDLLIGGALGFYWGGVVRRHQGTWSIDYDEQRDTPPFVVGGPFPDLAKLSDGTVVLPVDGKLVRRSAAATWSVIPSSDGGVRFTTVAAADGRLFGVGEHVYELEDAALGLWRQRAAAVSPGAYLRSAALDGEALYAVGNGASVDYLALAGSADAWTSTSFPFRLNAVAVLQPGDVWAVGAQGTVLRHGPSGWRQVPGPPGELVGIVGSAGSVYIGAVDGTVYRYRP